MTTDPYRKPDDGHAESSSREEARRALERSLDSLQEVLAQDTEVSRVAQSLRTFRQGDAFALDLENAMRGHR